MDLWIRSQDRKRLTKVNSVNILEFDGCIAIHGYINSDTHFWLANYKTKERALEVLDEINRHIEELYNCKYGIEYDLSQFTYEMPEE